MIMDHAFDFALLFISTCSALYCWTLSRRLYALQNLRKGVGQAMVNLTKSVTAVETNAQKLNREALAAVSELRVMLSRVDACEEQIDLLLETMDRQAQETWKEYKARHGELQKRTDASYQRLSSMVAEAEGLGRTLQERAASPYRHGGEEARALPAKESAAPKDTDDQAATAEPEKKRATRTVLTGDREMTAREVALAKLLAARRAKKQAEEADGQGAEEASSSGDGETASQDVLESFQRRLRERRAKSRRDGDEPGDDSSGVKRFG